MANIEMQMGPIASAQKRMTIRALEQSGSVKVDYDFATLTMTIAGDETALQMIRNAA